MPRNANPATWMLDVIGAGVVGKTRQIADYATVFDKNEQAVRAAAEVETLSKPVADAEKKLNTNTSVYATSVWNQFKHVFTRFVVSHWRNVEFNFTRLMIITILGVIFGLVYLQVDDTDAPGVASKIGVVFMTTTFNGVIYSATALPVLVRLRAAFYREQSSNTYSSWAYSTSLLLLDLPYIFLGTFLFMLSSYFMIGFENSAQRFFEYFASQFMLSVCFSYLGQLVSVLAPDIIVANILQGTLFTFVHLFGGVFIRAPDIPIGWQWFYEMNPVPKAIKAIVMQQMECTLPVEQCVGFTALVGGQPQYVPRHIYVAEFLDMVYGGYNSLIGWLVLTAIALHLLVALGLRFVRHIKR